MEHKCKSCKDTGKIQLLLSTVDCIDCTPVVYVDPEDDVTHRLDILEFYVPYSAISGHCSHAEDK